MITQAQLDRLPEVLREIVDHDRAIAAERQTHRREAVIDFIYFRGLVRSRAGWRQLAKARWAHQLRGTEGPAPA